MSATLSVCMIARDEAARIGASLDSVREVADELIVVDTGSIDDTLAVAQARNARIVREPWRDDFARARNRALDEATKDWVLFLDADERLGAGQREALRALLEQPLDAYYVEVRSAVTDGGVERTFVHRFPRLFRRDPRIRYRRRVHEQVTEALEAMQARTAQAEIRIEHAGYATTPEKRTAKLLRNLKLLKLDANEFPHDPAVHYHLGETCSLLGDPATAVTHYRRAIFLQGLPHDHEAAAHQNLASAFLALGRWDDAVASAEAALDLEPALRTPLLIRASARVRLAQFDDAIADVDQYITRMDDPQRPSFGFEPDLAKALLVRAESNLRAGRVDEAADDASRLLRRNPAWPAALRLTARVCAARGDREGELRHMQHACDLEPDNVAAWKELVALHIRRSDLDGARRCVKRALSLRRTAELLRLRAWLRFQAGEVEGALGALREALELEPSDAGTQARIAELTKLTPTTGGRT